ncbi:hypothetical protein GLOIN_2v1786507 [Rhizophagus clarus]|uniref:CCHC-type domain-containing protein n=1 Tax=Rhizophagus clarus TaxID=94130 RepID=A0A8H3LR36_9GLOM|nr:hypothetical protein GLOIN_2v1786507 [Rhizophagus clarus]
MENHFYRKSAIIQFSKCLTTETRETLLPSNQDNNEVFIVPTLDLSTRLNSPEVTIQVKKELVKKNLGHSIIDPEVQIIFEVDEKIINDTYVFQPIEVKFNEPHTAEKTTILDTQAYANHQQDFLQMQIDQITSVSDHQTDDPDIETIVVNKYSMFTFQSNFFLTNKKDKAHEAALHFHQYTSFISALPGRKKNNNTSKLENVITTDDSGTETIEYKEFFFTTKHKEPAVLLPEQKEDENSRTIQVIDISLYLTKNIIQTVNHFYYKWSHLIGTYSVRVLLYLLSDDKREEQKAFDLRLSGLPFSTNASDLTEIIKQINGRTCFILRHPKTYKLMIYAYIQFQDQESRDIAKNTLFKYTKGQIKNRTLYLSDPVEKPKICNKCGSPDHIYVSCPNKNKKYNNNKQNQHTKNISTSQKKHSNSSNANSRNTLTKTESSLDACHKKYLQELLNTTMLDIKDQISKKMSQIKTQVSYFSTKIKEFKDQRANCFLDRMENEKPPSAKKTAEGEHAQYETIKLEGKYRKTDYKGDDDNIIE